MIVKKNFVKPNVLLSSSAAVQDGDEIVMEMVMGTMRPHDRGRERRRVLLTLS